MKFKTKLLIGLPIAFIIGGIFAYIMLYVFFANIPSSSHWLIFIKKVLIYTVGLPLYLAMIIASLPFVGLFLCGSNAASTFGCWGGNSFLMAIVIYGVLFAFIYYLLAKRKK